MCWDKIVDAEQPAEENHPTKQASEPGSSLEELLKQLLAVRAESSSPSVRPTA